MKISVACFASLASVILLSACATGTKALYEWGGYQSALLSYTKNPDETQKFADRLSEIIVKAELTGAVPPGVYAEYGYALLTLNRTPEALEQFAKERAKWPESAKLMDGVISRLSKTQPQQSTVPAAPSTGDGKQNVPEVPTMTPTAAAASPPARDL